MTVTKVSMCWSVRGWEGLLGFGFTAVGCSAESVAVVCCSAGQVECVCECLCRWILCLLDFMCGTNFCVFVQLAPCVCLICKCLSRSKAVGLGWARHVYVWVCVCVCQALADWLRSGALNPVLSCIKPELCFFAEERLSMSHTTVCVMVKKKRGKKQEEERQAKRYKKNSGQLGHFLTLGLWWQSKSSPI